VPSSKSNPESFGHSSQVTLRCVPRIDRGIPKQCSVQVRPWESPDCRFVPESFYPRTLVCLDPKQEQERAWPHFEMAGSFGGSEPFNGFGMFRR
jgi:hypothetical protein